MNNKQVVKINESQLKQIVVESVKKVLKETSSVHNKSWNNLGHYFDLDQTTKAYELGNAGKHWTDTDYSMGDDSWDEESYYKDFDEWWSNLPQEEKERIYYQMNK